MFKCFQGKRVSSVATIWTKRQVSFLLHPTFLNLINTSSQKCDASNLLTTPNVKTNISTDAVLQAFKNTSTS